MDHGSPEPRVRKRRLAVKAKGQRDLSDLIGDGGQLSGAPKRLLNWKLDWATYFQRFCEAHGGNPVEIGGKLVLPDGWSYSCTSHKGPEWPPPQDPVARAALIAAYWAERKGIVGDELRLLKETRRGIKELLVARDQPVVKVVGRQEMVDGKVKQHWDRSDLNLDEIDLRIKWLEDDVAHADQMLLELKGTSDEQTEILQGVPGRSGGDVVTGGQGIGR